MENNRSDYVRVLRKNGQNLLEGGATVADGQVMARVALIDNLGRFYEYSTISISTIYEKSKFIPNREAFGFSFTSKTLHIDAKAQRL